MKPSEFMALPLEERRELMRQTAERLAADGYGDVWAYDDTQGADVVAILGMQDRLAEALALLREATPKCDECGEIATWFGRVFEGEELLACDQHKDTVGRNSMGMTDDDLGRRIKALLEEQP